MADSESDLRADDPNHPARIAYAAACARADEATDHYNKLVFEQNELIASASTPGQLQRVKDLDRAMLKAQAEYKEADAAKLRANQASAAAMIADPRLARFPAVDFSHLQSRNDRQTSTGFVSMDRSVDSARRLIERHHKSGKLPSGAAERATALVEKSATHTERSLSARWVEAAGSDDYLAAFAKIAADPTRGHLTWSPAESDAYKRANSVNSEMRAMSTISTSGGYMLPLVLDPSIRLTNDGSNNPLRQLASIRTTISDRWKGITSAGATAEWHAESTHAAVTEVADGSPVLAEAEIPTHAGDVFIPYSFEVGMDAVSFVEQITAVMLDAADNLQAAAFTTGNGTTQPQGIVTGLVGTASEINGGGSEALVAADAYTLQAALPARFSGNASWLSHISVKNGLGQFETGNGSHSFPELRDTPPHLLGKRWYELSNMDGSINAAATANNHLLLYGDVRSAYTIVDRVGATVEFIPHIFGTTTGRPTRQRGMLLWFRVGAKVVIPQAMRMLDVPTTA